MDCCHPALMADSPALDAALFLGTGFLMSLGHCVGMCGPLVGAYCAAQGTRGHQPTPARSLWPAMLIYHAGRITSYALLGLAFASLGSVIGAGRATWQAGLSLLAGGLMLALGLGLVGWLPTQRWVESSRLGRAVATRMGTLLAVRRAPGRFALGMGNGFLPCGPVYAMAAGTVAAAQPLLGAGAMGLYGVGTLPVLLVLGFGAGRLAPRLQKHFTRIGSILVLAIGAQLLLRGMAALGWVGHLKWGDVVIW